MSMVCMGQSLALQVIGSTGHWGSLNSGGDVHSTLGEIQVASYSNGHLTPGFHQYFQSGTNSYHQPELDVSLQLFPNPATDWCVLSTDSKQALQFELFDLNGAMLQRGQIPAGSSSRIDLGAFSAGQFLVRIRDSKGASKSLKLIKISN